MAASNSAAPGHGAGDRRTWTVGELLDWTEGHFRARKLATPRLDAELLLAKALGVERLGLYRDYQKPVAPDERARFRELVERRGHHEPVAYITGEKEFYSLAFEVGPAVLVPRPETEHLVDEALRVLRDEPRADDAARRVLDLGTGSGNLAIAIAVNAEDVQVVAVDTQSDALAVARRNAARHDVGDRIRFVEGDLFAPLNASRPYDVIVSNPPYVARHEYDSLMPDVQRWEPRTALLDTRSADGDGLGHYRTIAQEAPAFLVAGGTLAVEVGCTQAAAVEQLFCSAGLIATRCIRDYGGVDRIVAGERDA